MAALGQQPSANADPLADFKAPAAALPLLEELLLKKDVSSAMMIFDAEMIVPVGDIAAMSPADRQNLVRVRNWAADKEMIGNAVFLVTTDVGGLHETVRSAASRFEQIAIPYPDLDARKAFIEGIDWNGTRFETDLDEFARLTAALNLVQIEDIAIKAAHSGALKREFVPSGCEWSGDLSVRQLAAICSSATHQAGARRNPRRPTFNINTDC